MAWLLLLVLFAGARAAAPPRQGRTVELVKGRCYHWSVVYSPKLTAADWDRIVAFHRQFEPLGGEPHAVTFERARQRVAYELVASVGGPVSNLGIPVPATHLPGELATRVRGVWDLRPCDLPEV